MWLSLSGYRVQDLDKIPHAPPNQSVMWIMSYMVYASVVHPYMFLGNLHLAMTMTYDLKLRFDQTESWEMKRCQSLDLTLRSWDHTILVLLGSSGKAASICPAGVPEASLLPGYDWHLQAQEEGAAVRGLWSKQNFGPSLPASSSNKVSFPPVLFDSLWAFSFKIIKTLCNLYCL